MTAAAPGGPVDPLGSPGRGLGIAAAQGRQRVQRDRRQTGRERVVERVVDEQRTVAANRDRLLRQRRGRSRIAEAHRVLAGQPPRAVGAEALPIARHPVAPEEIEVHQTLAVGDHDELVLAAAGAHQRRRRARAGAESDLVGVVGRAGLVGGAPAPAEPVGGGVVAKLAHPLRGDDVDPAPLVGGDAVGDGLDLGVVGGAVASIQVHGPQPRVAHRVGPPGHGADDAALGGEGDVAVVGERRSDEPVAVPAEGAVWQLVALAQLDRRARIALDRVLVDIDPAAAGHVEAARAVEDVVGAGDPALTGRRAAGLAFGGHVEIDQPARVGVGLEQDLLVGAVHERTPGHAAPARVATAELDLDRDAGEVDVLGPDPGAPQALQRRGGLRVGTPVRCAPGRVGQVGVAGGLGGAARLLARTGLTRGRNQQEHGATLPPAASTKL